MTEPDFPAARPSAIALLTPHSHEKHHFNLQRKMSNYGLDRVYGFEESDQNL